MSGVLSLRSTAVVPVLSQSHRTLSHTRCLHSFLDDILGLDSALTRPFEPSVGTDLDPFLEHSLVLLFGRTTIDS